MVAIHGNNVSALQAYGRKMGVSAHNVANVNTDEFKKSQAVITEAQNDSVKVSISQAGAQGSLGSETQGGQPVQRELSNTDLAEEFTQQIVTQRGFEANAHTIRTHDDMLGTVIDIMG